MPDTRRSILCVTSELPFLIMMISPTTVPFGKLQFQRLIGSPSTVSVSIR